MLASRLMRDFDPDAALVAWGLADLEADCGHADLCHTWIEVMGIILAQTPSRSRTEPQGEADTFRD